MGDNGEIAAIGSVITQLTTLTGTRPRVTEEPGAVRIEIAVTEALLPRWDRLVAILDLGTSFGLTDTDAGQIAWLRLDTGGGTRP